MKKFYQLFILLLAVSLTGCSDDLDLYGVNTGYMTHHRPICHAETTVAVYDNNGMYSVPGCVDYDFADDADYYDYDDSDFPQVEDNKYQSNQVILENLNTRVLAYCRGSDEEIEMCVNRLKESCYVKLQDIPKRPAKYDILQRGTYPTRRWRNGETTPRW
ncbi:MAG: hypothetical protein IJ778_01140 [Alphaproteobacteria bacterium]|nr:hypothetical protein [Alphaproteobacteria bacterium]